MLQQGVEARLHLGHWTHCCGKRNFYTAVSMQIILHINTSFPQNDFTSSAVQC